MGAIYLINNELTTLDFQSMVGQLSMLITMPDTVTTNADDKMRT